MAKKVLKIDLSDGTEYEIDAKRIKYVEWEENGNVLCIGTRRKYNMGELHFPRENIHCVQWGFK